MNEWILLLPAVISLGLLVWLVARSLRPPEFAALSAKVDALGVETRRVESSIRDDVARSAAALREEVGLRLERGFQSTLERQDAGRRETDTQIGLVRAAVEQSLKDTRAEVRAQLTEFQAVVRTAHEDARRDQGLQLADFSQRLAQLQTGTADQLERVRQTVDARIADLQNQNSAKLEEMRQTVDQRLQATLEQRLSESFKLVGDNLERVIRGLGEMQQMAASVGDLKRVLTNVKSRGTWGEVQLASLLENLLTSEQYAANVAPVPGSAERVEFAVKLPGREAGETPVWLPIDAKFPVEDYERLVAAADRADPEGVADAAKALANRVYAQAGTIASKYLAPPHTTDFAILFLPTEGLYAEVLRQPGLADSAQRDHRVVIAGPTTLAALLNSLQMGFRTLAIEKRASEVWRVLGAVKTEFGKFGEVLDRVQGKLESASKEIERTGVRSRAIERKLRGVEALPASEAALLLPEDAQAAPDEV